MYVYVYVYVYTNPLTYTAGANATNKFILSLISLLVEKQPNPSAVP